MRTFIPLFAVVGFISVLFYHSEFENPQSLTPSVKMNGVSLVNPHRVIDSSHMAEVKRVHSDWVAVIPIAFSRRNEPEVYFNNRRQWWGERIDGTAALIRLAQNNQLKVMLKPHVWLRELWIGDFDLDSEVKWQQWEESYRQYLMAFAHLADSMGVDMLCIGTELKVPAVQRPEYFRQLIKDVRVFYDGKITYAANWDNYEYIPFWDELDYIGVDGYFPLLEAENPDSDQIEKAWEPVEYRLKSFSEQWGKQILFTEYGYQSLNGAVGNHWELKVSEQAVNLELQAKAYEGFYRCLWNEPWVAGGFLWKWHFREHAGGPEDGNFTPQGKPAEAVIASWYSRNQRELIRRSD